MSKCRKKLCQTEKNSSIGAERCERQILHISVPITSTQKHTKIYKHAELQLHAEIHYINIQSCRSIHNTSHNSLITQLYITQYTTQKPHDRIEDLRMVICIVGLSSTLRKLYFQFLSYRMGYDRGDSFHFDFEPNEIPFG